MEPIYQTSTRITGSLCRELVIRMRFSNIVRTYSIILTLAGAIGYTVWAAFEGSPILAVILWVLLAVQLLRTVHVANQYAKKEQQRVMRDYSVQHATVVSQFFSDHIHLKKPSVELDASYEEVSSFHESCRYVIIFLNTHLLIAEKKQLDMPSFRKFMREKLLAAQIARMP